MKVLLRLRHAFQVNDLIYIHAGLQMLNPAEAGFRAWTETRGWGAEEGSRHSPL
jgi:hypothetical protein